MFFYNFKAVWKATATPGRTQLIERVIRLRDETLIRQPKFRIPEKLKPEIEAELNRLLTGGFLAPCSSEHVSNSVIVRRPGNKIRLCTDLRAINSRTIPSGFRMADMQDILSKAAGSKCISLIDVNKFFLADSTGKTRPEILWIHAPPTFRKILLACNPFWNQICLQNCSSINGPNNKRHAECSSIPG
jgi:hypothetical protein